MHQHATSLSEIGPTRVSDAVRVGHGQPSCPNGVGRESTLDLYICSDASEILQEPHDIVIIAAHCTGCMT